MAAKRETVQWEGHSSQIINIVPFSIATVMFLTVFLIPLSIFITVWYYLVAKNLRYEITTERVKIYSGVLNKNANDVELYRVKDMRLFEPWYLRIFGFGHVIILTSDLSQPNIILRAIKNAPEVREMLRNLTEERRKARGIASLDVI